MLKKICAILLSVLMFITALWCCWLLFLVYSSDFFNDDYKTGTRFEIYADKVKNFSVISGENPVMLKAISIKEFQIESKINDYTETHDSVKAGDVYLLEMNCEDGVEYDSKEPVKVVLTSRSEFKFKVPLSFFKGVLDFTLTFGSPFVVLAFIFMGVKGISSLNKPKTDSNS